MSLSDLIAIDPEIVGGKPVIRGTRLAVEFILELLAAGQSESDLIANYPGLTREDILACLSYAKLARARRLDHSTVGEFAAILKSVKSGPSLPSSRRRINRPSFFWTTICRC